MYIYVSIYIEVYLPLRAVRVFPDVECVQSRRVVHAALFSFPLRCVVCGIRRGKSDKGHRHWHWAGDEQHEEREYDLNRKNQTTPTKKQKTKRGSQQFGVRGRKLAKWKSYGGESFTSLLFSKGRGLVERHWDTLTSVYAGTNQFFPFPFLSGKKAVERK